MAQNTQVEKPANDACPTWNSKDQKSKAEYFRFLQNSKNRPTKNNSQYATTPSNNYSLTKSTAPQQPRYTGSRTKKSEKDKSNANIEEKPITDNSTASQEEVQPIEVKKETEEKKEEPVVVKHEEKEIKEEVKKKPSSKDKSNDNSSDKKEKSVTKEKSNEKASNTKASDSQKDINTQKIKQETKSAGRKVKKIFKRKHKTGKATSCPDF